MQELCVLSAAEKVLNWECKGIKRVIWKILLPSTAIGTTLLKLMELHSCQLCCEKRIKDTLPCPWSRLYYKQLPNHHCLANINYCGKNSLSSEQIPQKGVKRRQNFDPGTYNSGWYSITGPGEMEPQHSMGTLSVYMLIDGVD